MKAVMITAIWCPSCIIMRSRYQELFKQLTIDVTEYDFDDDSDIVDKYHIGSVLPVVIFEDNHQELMRINGEKSKKELFKLTEGLKK